MTINKARALHHLLMGAAVAGLLTLSAELTKLSILNLSKEPALRTVIIAVLASVVSAGIGILISDFMSDPPPPPPSMNVSNK